MFAGSVYRGDVDIIDSYLNHSRQVMKDILYTVMDFQTGMTCDGGFDGIFGFGFDASNLASVVPDGNAMSLVQTYEVPLDGPHQANSTVGSCQTSNFSKVEEHSPIRRALTDGRKARFGLALHYEATKTVLDITSHNLGILYMGAAAVDNHYYKAGSPKTVSTYWKNSHGATLSWDFSLAGFTINRTDPKTQRRSEEEEVSAPQDACSHGSCFVDTGSPSLVLPPAVCRHIYDGLPNPGDMVSLHLFVNRSTSNDTVTLMLPLDFLVTEKSRGFVDCTPSEKMITLGMPIFQYYYIAFDATNSSITFVDRISDK